MKAIEYLERLTKLDYLIGNKLAEQKEYDYLAEELGKEIEPLNLNQYIQEQQEIISTLEQLPTMSYIVLYKYYYEHKLIQEIAKELDKSRSWTGKKHVSALAELQKLLDEREGKA